MSKPSDSKALDTKASRSGGRRGPASLLHDGWIGVAAAAVVPLASGEAEADESQAERVKARYKENRSRQELLSRQPLLMGPRTCDQAKRWIGRPGAFAGCRRRPGFGVLDRRTFLQTVRFGRGCGTGLMPLGSVRKAQAGPKIVGAPTEIKKNICTHCSVGCTVIAEVQNGVWVGQEPAWDSPINRGSHCAKGASVRELVHGDRRLKYPMKLVNGEWQRLSWDQAINEIGDKMLEIRAKSGADSVYLLAPRNSPMKADICSASSRRSGHQLDRSSGPHLPFDHGRRRREYLGLRRDDQLLQ